MNKFLTALFLTVPFWTPHTFGHVVGLNEKHWNNFEPFQIKSATIYGTDNVPYTHLEIEPAISTSQCNHKNVVVFNSGTRKSVFMTGLLNDALAQNKRVFLKTNGCSNNTQFNLLEGVSIEMFPHTKTENEASE